MATATNRAMATQQGWWETKGPMAMVARAMVTVSRVAGEQQ